MAIKKCREERKTDKEKIKCAEKREEYLGSKFILHVIIYIPLYNKEIFNRANGKELKKRETKVTKKIYPNAIRRII